MLKKRLKVLFHSVSEEAASSKTGGGHTVRCSVKFFPNRNPIYGSFQLYYLIQTIAFIPLIQKLEIKKELCYHLIASPQMPLRKLSICRFFYDRRATSRPLSVSPFASPFHFVLFSCISFNSQGRVKCCMQSLGPWEEPGLFFPPASLQNRRAFFSMKRLKTEGNNKAGHFWISVWAPDHQQILVENCKTEDKEDDDDSSQQDRYNTQ